MPEEMIVKACRSAWTKAGKGAMLLGVSGGADSTALLVAFAEAHIPFEVAHCNFNLRGDESLRDRRFVEALCGEKGIRLHIADFDTTRQSLKGESVEMTCRRLRYDFFRNLMAGEGFTRIVIAHNAEDNTETFFLNALRGSGTRGLRGMEADNGEVMRPLLQFRRQDILDFLQQRGQQFVTDSSNLHSDAYRRNFLRNHIFPLLEDKWKGFHKAISTTIDLQRHENRIVEHYIAEALKGSNDHLAWETLEGFPDSLTLIFRFINPYGGSAVIAAEMAAAALNRTPGKLWLLGEGFKAVFSRAGIKIERSSDASEASVLDSFLWERLEGDCPDMGKVRCAPLSEVYLPYGPERYEWLHPYRDMRIRSLGMNGSQIVMKVLKDAGLTMTERKSFLLLCDKETGDPVWLPGIKRSRIHLIDASSPFVWHVRQR